MVASNSSTITIPAAGASDTRLVLGTGLPSGSVSFNTAMFIESFSSTGSNTPTLGVVTYADNTQATVNSNSITRSTGNALDTKIKSFTFTSPGTSNSSNSHITLTVSGHPVWTLQDSDVQTKIDAVIDSAPGALDTLNELAAALGDDASFSTTVTNSLATKIGLTDLSVTSNSASGGGTLSYNNSSGAFTFTPPDLSSFLTSVSFASLTGKPTTIAGYGITDAFSGVFADLTSKPTTLTGYGITDAAPLASPALTGTPTAPTASYSTNTTQIATTAFVQSALSGFSSGANVSVSSSAPGSPSAGDLWFDDDALVLYVYYADGSSNQWVQTNPSSAASVSSVEKYKEKTSNYVAVAGEKLIVDTSNAVTITLPATAAIGDEIRIIDGTGNAATNNITVARNGHKIEGATSVSYTHLTLPTKA